MKCLEVYHVWVECRYEGRTMKLDYLVAAPGKSSARNMARRRVHGAFPGSKILHTGVAPWNVDILVP